MGQKQTCALQEPMSALPPKATSIAAHGMSAKGQKLKGSCRAKHVRFSLKCRHGRRSICASALCHVWTAPSWQELSSRLQHWSVQPCVRPLSAAHRAAGHNALRGSGPDQKHAFDHALAQVGCPDRRIDRLCITCCSPSQPSHHAGCPARSRLRRKRDGFLVALAPGHQHPHHPRNLVGERDGGNLARPSC
jgi:hypothetical protein